MAEYNDILDDNLIRRGTIRTNGQEGPDEKKHVWVVRAKLVDAVVDDVINLEEG